MVIIARGVCGMKTAIVIALVFFIHVTESAGNGAVFDVTKFGCKGDGKPEYNEDNESIVGLAFIQAWQKACNNIAPSTVLIPKGTFVVAQVLFSGPCQTSVTVQLEGDIIPDPDISQFPNNELFVFQQVEGVTFTGSGTINVNLPKTPSDPEKDIIFMDIMPTISVLNVTNYVMDGIHSMNPSAFHVLVDTSHNVTITNVNFEASTVMPNTHSNGIYMSSSSLVTITNSNIRTGDDCITISGGSTDVTVNGVTCVNGQGISVGAQPIGCLQASVSGVKVTNCTFKSTTYGARINPRPHETLGQVSNIIFQDLVMDQAQNPITINQDFPTKPNKPHHAKITDVHFKNIRGTTTTNTAVSLSCSKISPCDAEVGDINLTFSGKALPPKGTTLSAICSNAKVTFIGKHDGLSCM